MIIGIGTDIIEISRIHDAINKNDNFIERIFTSNEIEMFDKKNINSIAANFAGKEAVFKVFGTGLRDFKWKDIEILRDQLGKPYVVVYNNAIKIKDNLGIDEIQVSLSHSKIYAIAFAVGIKK